MDYDLGSPGPKGTIKLKNINLADYPPDKPGPITRFFKDRPVLKQLGSMGLSAAASYASSKALELIQSHFESVLEEARKDFQTNFPDTASLLQNAHIEELRKAYNAALLKLRLPDARRKLVLALATIGPEKDIDARLRAAEEYLARLGDTTAMDVKSYRSTTEAYENAMANLVTELSKHPWAQLPDIVNNIEQRASLLQSAGQDLEDTFWLIAQSPLVLWPGIEAEALNIYYLGGNFKNLGANVRGFATEINARQNDYEKLYHSLDKELIEVGNRINFVLESPLGKSGRAP